MPDWKDTLTLPRTAFPMKANLQKTEPEAIARWERMDLYGLLRARRAGAPKFVLHDGPPYANGRIHLGTAFNKILKDFVVRARTMAGYDAPYVPGWDCHGLPIELRVDRELGSRKRDMSVGQFRRACRDYANRFVEVQRGDFERLGVLGAWKEPYLTMSFGYQARIIRALGRFVEQGMVYKGKKPVHWCINCRTALAEAEVEYESHVSPSIYVEFMLAPGEHAELGRRVPALAGVERVSVLIWTTTPWTIPANLALAFHPDHLYGAYQTEGTVVVVAEELAARVESEIGKRLGPPMARTAGATFEGLRFLHPLYERDSLAVVADYVTLDQGTGVVHTAPGHGSDDFNTGIRYGLDIHAPVGPGGQFLDSVELFGGVRVFEANPRIEEALSARGRLWHRDSFEHAYPHCWRCRNPVIFLATSQWFIGIDVGDLRGKALEATSRVRWIPAWGEERMRNMFAARPDWCISRQRSWGVPIPAVDCTACNEAILTTGLVERTATVFERHGADAWYELPIEEFLPSGMSCPSCGSSSFEREKDILDVWFDSGSSHEAVLSTRDELRWPADLYLEGTDQYRGWFQSSMLVGLGTRGEAPYRDVVTHGFVVNEEGRKMSKSLGNDVPPQEIIAKSGAEILRLWAVMADYREEVRIGPEILARVVEAYRKIRNTCRILVANLHDFDPARGTIPPADLQEVDRYALARYAEAASRMLKAYEEYDFPVIFHTLNTLMAVDISAFYVDVSKDRLYTFAPGAAERRSAQTAMYLMADGLTKLMAPILPVTADDLWQHLPGERAESVHLADFPDVRSLVDPPLLALWSRLLRVRDEVNAAIEVRRKEKLIGTSLEARVSIGCSGADAELLERRKHDLPMVFIVSQVELQPRAEGSAPGALTIDVGRAEGVKCERCWRYVTLMAERPEHAGICARCAAALESGAGSGMKGAASA
jgi:isoleucyl-tRNA synthetase